MQWIGTIINPNISGRFREAKNWFNSLLNMIWSHDEISNEDLIKLGWQDIFQENIRYFCDIRYLEFYYLLFYYFSFIDHLKEKEKPP